MINKRQVGEGNVTVRLPSIDGVEEELTLRPSWIAAQTISRQSGGIMGAIERILKLDLDTINLVIQLGMGYHGNRRAPPDLQEKLWRAGYSDESSALVERTVLYLRVLANGGRMPKEDDQASEVADPADPPQ